MQIGRKAIAVTLLTASAGIGFDRVLHTQEACRLVHAYHAVQKANAPINFWERLLFSVALANARTAAKQPEPCRSIV